MRFLNLVHNPVVKKIIEHAGLSATRRTEHSEYEHFFRCTSGRWIYNEQEQMRIRYVSFNVDALKQLATTAARANQCVEMVKIAEGSFNKIFRLTFDNGEKLIAKIPCPLSAPPRLCTASEVATMDYARNVLGVPVPHVLRWNADADASEVGTEYILMEHVQGVELYQRKQNFGKEGRAFVDNIVDIECKFTRRRFSQIGSLYYKEDVSPALQERPLYAEGEQDGDGSDRFRIGPYVEWDIWRGKRSDIRADRGPWPDALSYIKALIDIEKKWITNFAIPRQPHDTFRCSGNDNLPDTHIRLLDDFLAVLPSILPGEDLCTPVLWHNDLHAANIFVAPEGQPDISGLIDWQGISVRPLFLAAGFASCLKYDGDERIVIPPGITSISPPPGYDSLPEEEKAYMKKQLRFAAMHKYYEIRVMQRNPPYFASQTYPNIEHIIPPIYSASRTWYEGPHHLRQMLLDLHGAWEGIAPGVPYPVSWDADEIARHREEYPKLMEYEDRIAQVVKGLQLEGDGWVTNERFDDVKRRNTKIIKNWNPKELGGPYPFQDGGPSWFLS
ncbi:kinase-like domain-containing protein [Phlebopus sp. FC_14]|nr:kinase-like domain-containing protein [Phlebopus sp. FC_14]